MILSVKDKQAVKEAIRKAERTTSGEIVFAVSDASGEYRHATLQGALVGAIAASAVYLALPVPHTTALLLWTELIAFAVVYSVLPHLPWRRWFISGREMEEHVHDAAFREFYAGGLYRTREENGVIIYLSLLERRVVVLGDRGIHEKMGDRRWREVRDRIIEGIGKGRAAEGICAAVEICGRTLAEHFPFRDDDVNELPDDVIDHTHADTKR